MDVTASIAARVADWKALLTLCLGHSLGMHRLLIHRSYECPKLLEYVFVYCGVLVGLAGPRGMMKTHSTRDWAQRQTQCHDYFSHQQAFLVDGFWQIFCELRLANPPSFRPPRVLASDHLVWHIKQPSDLVWRKESVVTA